jgi:hypothetical protein
MGACLRHRVLPMLAVAALAGAIGSALATTAARGGEPDATGPAEPATAAAEPEPETATAEPAEGEPETTTAEPAEPAPDTATAEPAEGEPESTTAEPAEPAPNTATAEPAEPDEPPSRAAEADDEAAPAGGSGDATTKAGRGYATPPETALEVDEPVALADGGEPLEVPTPVAAEPEDEHVEADGSGAAASSPERRADPVRRTLTSARTRGEPAGAVHAGDATDLAGRAAGPPRAAGVSLLLLLTGALAVAWHRREALAGGLGGRRGADAGRR